jgi:hypothetical protein
MLLNFAFIPVIFVVANITDTDNFRIDEKLKAMEQLLDNNYNYLQNNIVSMNNSSNCTFNIACNDFDSWPNAIYPPPNLIENINYINQTVQLNDTVTKLLYGTQLSQKIINEICYVNSQKMVWEMNYESNENNSNLTGIMWQYYGGNSSVTIFNPAFIWPTVCSNNTITDYDPKNRPWYVSAISAQKNIIILIDLSDTLADPSGQRLTRMKQSALLLINSLSYRDFVGILTYTEFSKSYIPLMMRATLENINAITLYINSLVTSPNSKANIGSALNNAYTMLNNSINNGLTSKCNSVFIVLSSGANDVNTIKSTDIVRQNSQFNVIIFSNIYASGNTNGGILDLAEASCYTNGNLLTVDSDEDASYVVSRFNEYMGIATYNTFIRWSEPYNDAITGVRMITASLPIYMNQTSGLRQVIGVVAIDVALNSILINLDTNMTETDILNYLIKEQSCPSLQITPEFLNEIQSDDTCKQNQGINQNESNINKTGMIIGSVIIAIALVIFPYAMLFKNKETSTCGYEILLSFSMFVLGLWALCVLWIHLFPQIIKHEEWIATTCTVERITDNPSRCCEIVNCADCENYYGPSCNSLLGSLQEGPCQNGYYCCWYYSYTCGCYTSCSSSKYSTSCSTYCSTCFMCAQWVNNRRCDVVCGTCWDPTITFSFKDQNGNLNYGYTNIHCGLNDVACLNSFVDSGSPIGKSETCYFNPNNKNEIATSIAYSPGILAAFLIPAILMALIFIGVVVTLFVQWFT